jgi:DNA-directed RNA polymerase specialized sigma24 family protein
MPAPGRKQWDLTKDSFRRLLDFLDPDPQRAAVQYEQVRERLIRLFEWKGCVPGAEFADEAMDRVARRIESGMEEVPDNPYVFFHGVALNLIRERWRRAANDPQPLEKVPAGAIPLFHPAQADRKAEEERTAERRLSCLHECFDQLSPMSQELLSVYHLGDSGPKAGARRGLAEVLKIPRSALRLRVFRIRRQLEACLEQCLGRQPE